MDIVTYALSQKNIEKEIPKQIDDYCSEHFSEWEGALDDTLQETTMAAPAKTVGDAITTLNNALTNEIVVDNLNYILNRGIYINGSIYDITTFCLSVVPFKCDKGNKINYKGALTDGSVDYKCFVGYFKSDGTFVERVALLDSQTVTPYTAKHDGFAYIMFGRTSESEIDITNNDIPNCVITVEGNVCIDRKSIKSLMLKENVVAYWNYGTSINNLGLFELNKPTFCISGVLANVKKDDVITYEGDLVDSNGNNYVCYVATYRSNNTYYSEYIRSQLLTASGEKISYTVPYDGNVLFMFGRPSATNIPCTILDTEKFAFSIQKNVEPDVSVTPILESGVHIADITVGNTVSELYAPDGTPIKFLVPDCDFVSVPSQVVGADHWQALVKVGNEIWLSQNNSTVGGTINGVMDRISASDFSYIGKFNHNLGHLNAMSYDEDNDWLITGYASDNQGDAKDLYIFKNVLSWTELASGSNLDYSSVDKCVIHMGTYLSSLTGDTTLGNALWANKNSDGHRFVIVMTGVTNKKLVKISLGYGTTQRTYGTYTASSEGEPNGTFDVIWIKNLTMPTIADVTGIRTMVNQDFKYYKGGIMCAISAVPVTALFIYEINGSNNLGCDIIRSPWVNDSNVPQTGYNQGVLVMDDYVYVGIAPQTAGSTNPNKLAKFKI